MFWKIAVSKSAALFTMESAAVNCSKIKLVIYQFAFCWFFLEGGEVGANGQLYKRTILVSLFVVDFRKVL